METTGTGYFTALEGIVMFGGPAIWLFLVARLVYLANRAAGTMRSFKKANGHSA